MSNCNDSRDTAYQAGYKDGYQMGKSEHRTCNDVADHDELYFMCSECGYFVGDMEALHDYFNYCPNCGAWVMSECAKN